MTSAPTIAPPHIRWMIRRDMPEVLASDAAGFSWPWGEDDYLATLRRRNVIGMVAEAGDAVAGHMIYALHQHHTELLRLAVHPDHRGRGVGRALLARLAGKLSPGRRDRVEAAVRESGLGAQLFLRACGYRAVGVARGHYADSGEDGYRFRFEVAAPGHFACRCGRPMLADPSEPIAGQACDGCGDGEPRKIRRG